MKLRIEKPVYGGACLARDEGKAVFVPFTLPGEDVEARITQDKSSYAEAELERLLEESPHRVAPPCAYFGECGGCHYQHGDYATQLEMKAEILRESLGRARIAEMPEIQTLSGEALGYRNRIRLQIDRESSRLCYRKRSSHKGIAVHACPIAAPLLQEALKVIQAEAGTWRLEKYFSEIEMFADAEQRAMLLTLWSTGRERDSKEALQVLWPRIQEAMPKVIGATVFTAENGKRQSFVAATAGEQFLTYTAVGWHYRVSVGSFFQVNRFLIDALVETVAGESSGKLTWDLYAGVGLFSARLAERFERVVAVESAPTAVRDLRRNLEGEAHRVVGASTLEFLRRRAGPETPEYVVVDPPRAGLGKEVAAELASLRARQITYVSCDPATLSRDLKSLLDSGYHLNTLRMIDLFPQTFHLESVAELSLT